MSLNLGIVAHTHPAFEHPDEKKETTTKTDNSSTTTKTPKKKKVPPTSSSSEVNETSAKKDVSLKADNFDLVSLRSPKPPAGNNNNITSPKTARVSASNDNDNINTVNTHQQQQQSATGTPPTSLTARPSSSSEQEEKANNNQNNEDTTTRSSSRALVPTPKQSTLPVAVVEDLAKMKQQLILQQQQQKKTKSVLGGLAHTTNSLSSPHHQNNNNSSSSLAYLNKHLADFMKNGKIDDNIFSMSTSVAQHNQSQIEIMSDSKLPVVGGRDGSSSVRLPSSRANTITTANTSQKHPTSSQQNHHQLQQNQVAKLPPISLNKSSIMRSSEKISSQQHQQHDAGSKLTLQQSPLPTSPITHLTKKAPKHWTEMLPTFAELENSQAISYIAGHATSSGANGNNSSSSSTTHAVPPLATELLTFIRRELKLVYAPIFEEFQQHKTNEHNNASSNVNNGNNNNNDDARRDSFTSAKTNQTTASSNTSHNNNNNNKSATHLHQQLESVDIRLSRWRIFLDAYRCLCGHFKEYGALFFIMLREFEDMYEAIRHHISDRALFSLVANNAEEVALTLAKETTQNVFDELALTKRQNRVLAVSGEALKQEVKTLKEKNTVLQEEKVRLSNELVISHDRNRTLVDALQGEANRQNVAYNDMKALKEDNLRYQTAVRTLQEQAKKDSFLQEELFSKLDQVALALRDAGFDVSSVMSGTGGSSGGKLKKIKKQSKNGGTMFRKSNGGGFGDFSTGGGNDGASGSGDEDENDSDDFEDDDDDDSEDEANYRQKNDDDEVDNHRFVQNKSRNPNTLEGMRRIGSTLHKITMSQSKKMNQSTKKKGGNNKNSSNKRKSSVAELEGDEWMTMARKKADRRLSTVLESLTGDPTLEGDDDEANNNDKNNETEDEETELFRQAMNQKTKFSESSKKQGMSSMRSKNNNNNDSSSNTSNNNVQKIVTEARRDQNAADREKMIRESMKFAASCAGDTAAEKLQEALLRCFAKVRKYRSSITVLRSTIDRLEKKTKKLGSTLVRQQQLTASQANVLNSSGLLGGSVMSYGGGAGGAASRRKSSVLLSGLGDTVSMANSNNNINMPSALSVDQLNSNTDAQWGLLKNNQGNDSSGQFLSPEGSADFFSSHQHNQLQNRGAAASFAETELERVDTQRPLTPRPNWQRIASIVPSFHCDVDPDTGLLPSSDELLDLLYDRLREQQSDKLKEIERKILSKRVSGWLEDERGNKTHQVKSQKASDISSVLMASSRSFVGLGAGNEVPIYLRYTGRLRNRLLGKGDAELLLKRFWKARQDSVLPVVGDNSFIHHDDENVGDGNVSSSRSGNTFASPIARGRRSFQDENDNYNGTSTENKRNSRGDLRADMAHGVAFEDSFNNNNNNGAGSIRTKHSNAGFTEGSYAIPIDEFYQQWLQQTTGNPKAAIELAYSIHDVCERFQHDPDCGMFLKIMRGIVSEHCLAHEMYTVDQLKRVFMDLDTGKTALLPRSMVYRVLKQLFPSKRYGDALRLRFALIPFTSEDEEGHATVRYLDLFEEDHEGNQTTFVERLRHQHFDEALEVLVEIESAVRETQQTTGTTHRQIPLWQIAHSIRNVDARMPTNAIVHILVVGAQMAPSVVQVALDRHDSAVQVDVEDFFKRVRRGVYVRRYSPPPEDDLALLEDEADDVDIEENEEGQSAEADEKRLKELVKEEKEDTKREKEEQIKREQQAEAEAQANMFRVSSDKEKADLLLAQSLKLTKQGDPQHYGSGQLSVTSQDDDDVGSFRKGDNDVNNNNTSGKKVLSPTTQNLVDTIRQQNPDDHPEDDDNQQQQEGGVKNDSLFTPRSTTGTRTGRAAMVSFKEETPQHQTLSNESFGQGAFAQDSDDEMLTM